MVLGAFEVLALLLSQGHLLASSCWGRPRSGCQNRGPKPFPPDAALLTLQVYNKLCSQGAKFNTNAYLYKVPVQAIV